jgi:hypothetical protein
VTRAKGQPIKNTTAATTAKDAIATAARFDFDPAATSLDVAPRESS